MLSQSADVAHGQPTSAEVVAYIEEMSVELSDLALKHSCSELAASLSIVAVQAAGERRRQQPQD